MIFASTDLAARIESAECRLLSASAASVARSDPGVGVEVGPLAGGVAIYAGDESPLNKVAGLGFAGPLDEEELQRIEDMYRSRGVAVQVELSALAAPGIAPALSRRGYALMGFENVLGHSLTVEPGRGAGGRSDIAVDTVAQEGFDDWLDALVTGFTAPDAQGVPSHESFGREALERVTRHMALAEGMIRYRARACGELAGGASMRMDQGVAHLCGAATVPAHRRRGVQRALLERRLEDAADAGCDVAVVITMPGSTSQKNVQRLGFELLYTRAVLVKAPAASA